MASITKELNEEFWIILMNLYLENSINSVVQKLLRMVGTLARDCLPPKRVLVQGLRSPKQIINPGNSGELSQGDRDAAKLGIYIFKWEL